eukprot:TRINITY_DN2878_c0_g1_i2.p1 TRINITY_DN2878_c0_g1~~TRINITY_DN2878_c0_g1_i2.p1  ORF type:complete len:519 (-),score=114.60 TRINITY_DN2878_c0_g1_i2:219-1775(-)
MKLYAHNESEEITIIIKLENANITIAELAQTFIQLSKTKLKKNFSNQELTALNSSQVELDMSVLVSKKFKDGDDIYFQLKSDKKATDKKSTDKKSTTTNTSKASVPVSPAPTTTTTQDLPSENNTIKPKDKPTPTPTPPQPKTKKEPQVPDTTEISLARDHPLQDPPYPETFEASCPICGEFISYSTSAKEVICSTCHSRSIPVTFVDAQTHCGRCNRLIYRTRGKRVIVCDQCGARCASIHCDGCRSIFVFPDGIKIVPCPCGRRIPATNAVCNPVQRLGLLVNSDVNEPHSFIEEFESKNMFQYKINLVTQWFVDSSEERQSEINFALDRNMKCRHISKIHLLLESLSQLPTKYRENSKITCVVIGKRWKFKDAFQYCNENLKDEVCIVANADIFFDQTLNYLQRYPLQGKFLALTRHDLTREGTYRFNEWTSSVCQDSWIFLSPVPNKIDADFYFGWMGCDNRIAHEFKYSAQYHILNPSLKIITRHVHMSEKRNYTEQNKVIGEYTAVPPNGDM